MYPKAGVRQAVPGGQPLAFSRIWTRDSELIRLKYGIGTRCGDKAAQYPTRGAAQHKRPPMLTTTLKQEKKINSLSFSH